MMIRLAFVASLAVPALAFADIPPPAGYVEQCTIEKQCKAEEEGVTCRAYHSDREVCDKTHGKDGYTRRCKTRGASAWSEVWCRPKAKADKKK